jgi:hypothetical protein
MSFVTGDEAAEQGLERERQHMKRRGARSTRLCWSQAIQGFISDMGR